MHGGGGSGIFGTTNYKAIEMIESMADLPTDTHFPIIGWCLYDINDVTVR
jgi:hypothetical protein